MAPALLLFLAASATALIAPPAMPRAARRAARPGEVAMSAGSKKILVLGGDGFCGWPTSLHLSDAGHDVRPPASFFCFLRRTRGAPGHR